MAKTTHPIAPSFLLTLPVALPLALFAIPFGATSLNGCAGDQPCQIDSDCGDTGYCDFASRLCVDGDPPPAGPPAVQITSFSAEGSPLSAGESATLRWETQDATGCELQEGPEGTPQSVDANGVQTATPAATTEYTLSCTGGAEGDLATRTATVVVNRPVSIADFSASLPQLDRGSTTTLSWTAENASECALTDGVALSETESPVEVTPLVDTTYTLSCVGLGGPVSQTVEVQVAGIDTFTSTASLVAAGSEITLNWSVTAATDCAIAGQDAGSGDALTLTLDAGNHLFELNCTGYEGLLTASLQVLAAGVSGLTANPTSVVSGASASVGWNPVEVDQCALLTGTPEQTLVTLTPPSASYTLENLTMTQDYLVRCTRVLGDTTVTVEDGPITVTVQ